MINSMCIFRFIVKTILALNSIVLLVSQAYSYGAISSVELKEIASTLPAGKILLDYGGSSLVVDLDHLYLPNTGLTRDNQIKTLKYLEITPSDLGSPELNVDIHLKGMQNTPCENLHLNISLDNIEKFTKGEVDNYSLDPYKLEGRPKYPPLQQGLSWYKEEAAGFPTIPRGQYFFEIERNEMYGFSGKPVRPWCASIFSPMDDCRVALKITNQIGVQFKYFPSNCGIENIVSLTESVEKNIRAMLNSETN